MKNLVSVSALSLVVLASLAGCDPFFDPPGGGGETATTAQTTTPTTTTTTSTETGTDTGAGGGGGGGEDTGLSECALEKVSGACSEDGAVECDGELVCCGGHWLLAAKVGSDCGKGEGGGRTGGGGEGGGRPPSKGTLTVKAVLVDQTSNHKLQVRSLTDWDSPVTKEGTAGEFAFEVEPGSTFKFVGFTDPGTVDEQAWCIGAPTAIVVAFWAGPLPIQIVELPGSCAYRVVAAATECAGDADCDGDPDASDCKLDATVAHGLPETWGDSVDHNCDGKADPSLWTYTATGFPPNAPVVLEDYDTGVTHLMAYVPEYNAYSVSLVSGIEAPLRFVARTADGLQLSTYEAADGACAGLPLTVKNEEGEPVDKTGYIPPMVPDKACAQEVTPK